MRPCLMQCLFPYISNALSQVHFINIYKLVNQIFVCISMFIDSMDVNTLSFIIKVRFACYRCFSVYSIL